MSVATGHQRLDERSIALHSAIAEKLRAQPELLGVAHDNLNRWSVTATGSKPYLEEWREILEMPLDEMLLLIRQPDERMTSLRQSSPFAGVLSPKERWAIYSRFERHSDEA